VILVAAVRRRVDRRVLWIVVAIGGGLSVGFHATAVVHLHMPWDRSAPLTEAEATAIFVQLNRHIYTAFDAGTESAIYDTLATVITGELLTTIYKEVYASLALQEEGGAVCRVSDVSVPSSVVTFPDGPASDHFEVACQWRVTGSVQHESHLHERINTYRGTYTVRRVDHAWKIADVEVHDYKREDEKTPLSQSRHVPDPEAEHAA
jgi:hypothetical protein